MRNFTLREWFFTIWLLGCTVQIVQMSFQLDRIEKDRYAQRHREQTIVQDVTIKGN